VEKELNREVWTMRTASLVVLLLAVGCVAVAQPRLNTKTGTIEIIVSDTFGQPLRSFEVEIIGGAARQTVHKVSQKASAVELPYGCYMVRGSASMHQTFERSVLLDQPHLVVLVAFAFLDPGESELLYTPLLGRVMHLPPGPGKAWLRIVSVFGTFAKEGLVSAEGRFELSGVPYGEYFAIVLRDLQVLKVQRFSKTIREEEVAIDLRGVQER
jgi:hypothetical protein